MELQARDTTNLLIAFLLFIAFLLTGGSIKESPIFEVPEDPRADDPTRLKDCEFQPNGNKSIVQ
jgi:hypothetical protein